MPKRRQPNVYLIILFHKCSTCVRSISLELLLLLIFIVNDFVCGVFAFKHLAHHHLSPLTSFVCVCVCRHLLRLQCSHTRIIEKMVCVCVIHSIDSIAENPFFLTSVAFRQYLYTFCSLVLPLSSTVSQPIWLESI